MQLILVVPRIYGVLEIGANESVRSIQVQQANIILSLSMKSIPDLVPDAPIEGCWKPSESG